MPPLATKLSAVAFPSPPSRHTSCIPPSRPPANFPRGLSFVRVRGQASQPSQPSRALSGASLAVHPGPSSVRASQLHLVVEQRPAESSTTLGKLRSAHHHDSIHTYITYTHAHPTRPPGLRMRLLAPAGPPRYSPLAFPVLDCLAPWRPLSASSGVALPHRLKLPLIPPIGSRRHQVSGPGLRNCPGPRVIRSLPAPPAVPLRVPAGTGQSAHSLPACSLNLDLLRPDLLRRESMPIRFTVSTPPYWSYWSCSGPRRSALMPRPSPRAAQRQL